MQEFIPYFHYSDHDLLQAYWKPDSDYSLVISDEITLYKSLETDEIVGFKLFPVKKYLKLKKVRLLPKVESLDELLKILKPEPFKPGFYYNKKFKFLNVQWKDGCYYNDTITDIFDGFYDMDNHNLIGIKIYGIDL